MGTIDLVAFQPTYIILSSVPSSEDEDEDADEDTIELSMFQFNYFRQNVIFESFSFNLLISKSYENLMKM